MLALKALTLLLMDEDENQETSSKKARKHWVRPWLRNRQLFWCYYSLFQEIKCDAKAFKEFMKVVESQFEYLVQAITRMIMHQTTGNGLLTITLLSEWRDFPIVWNPVSYQKEDYISYCHWCLSSCLWDPGTTVCKYAQKHETMVGNCWEILPTMGLPEWYWRYPWKIYCIGTTF